MRRSPGPVEVDVHRVVAEGDLVADFWRFNDEGKMIEHWDVLQRVPDTTASGNDMFSQLT
jgi:predicted SnoaL-like aldol condensation-catalyzing enzyme